MSKLIELVGRGSTHCSTACEIARSALKDAGPNASAALQGMASCGTYGKNDQNTERDFLAFTKGVYGFELDPYPMQLCLEVAWTLHVGHRTILIDHRSIVTLKLTGPA